MAITVKEYCNSYCNWTVQLDEQECKLSAHIRYVYVLGNVHVTYNMLIILAHRPAGGTPIL